jgi:thymidylate synthase
MKTVEDIRHEFAKKYQNGEFTVDSQGRKTVEIVGENFIATDNTIFHQVNQDYVERELSWYLSQSLNVYDIPGKVPEVWKQVADKDGFINSNYGWCIFSEENKNQYRNCLRQLIDDPYTRRAVMIYTRPEMQYEYNKNGMSDFMCTCYTHQFVRNKKLVYIVYQRSCDAIFGFRNDLAWHQYVANKLVKDLRDNNIDVDFYPEIIFSCGSIHIYERHFKFIEQYIHKDDPEINA